MARKRLTNETLESVDRYAAAKEHVSLAESILGPGASDREVLKTAAALGKIGSDEVRLINRRRAAIEKQTRRLAGDTAGDLDPFEEPGPDQPDPTNTQAYVKNVYTTPDHAVLDSLQKRDVHAPTASRRRAKDRRDDEEDDMDIVDDLDDDDINTVEDMPVDDVVDRDDSEFEHPSMDDDIGEDDLGEDLDDDDIVDDDLGDEDLDEDLDDDDIVDDDLGDEDLDDEEMDLESGDDDLDSMLDFDEADTPLISEGESVDFGGVPAEMGEEEDFERRRQPRASRGQRRSGRRQAGKQPVRFTLDDLVNLSDEDVARTASTDLDGDDLEALLGAKVERAGNRVDNGMRVASTPTRMEGYVWDNTQEDIEAAKSDRSGRTRARSGQRATKGNNPASKKTKTASKKTKTASFTPDRRRIAARPEENPFDRVFDKPDISKYFQD